MEPTLKDQISTLEEQISDEKQCLKDLTTSREPVKKEYDAHKATMKDLQDQLRGVQSDEARFRKECKRRMDELRVQMAEETARFLPTKESYTTTTAQMSDLRRQIKDFREGHEAYALKREQDKKKRKTKRPLDDGPNDVPMKKQHID